MITISPPLSPAGAATYHTKEFANGLENYYATDAEIRGQWRGQLADHFSLAGAVERVHFERLAAGHDPHTNEALVRTIAPYSYLNAQGETVKPAARRAGWDAIFSAPKTVSLVALVGGDERVRTAHQESVAEALGLLEWYTQARVGGVRTPEPTRRFVAATFEHDSARPAGGYAAPQLHTHTVIFNMAVTASGQTHALQPRALFQTQALATAAYQAALALRLQALGYTVERGKSGQPEIKGFTAAYLNASSPRRQAIEAYLEQHPHLNGPNAARIAALATREPKQHLDKAAVLAAHQALAREHGNQAKKAVEAAHIKTRKAVELPSSLSAAASDAVQYAKDRGMERSAVVEDRTVLTDALKRGMGHTSVAAIRADFERRVDSREFLPRPSAPGSPARSFTTPEMVAMEFAALQRMRYGQGQHGPMAGTINQALLAATHRHLNPDQRAAVATILTSRDKVIGLEGIAGSGKTTTLAAVRVAAERAGYEVLGFAPSSTATQALAGAGMPTETLQRFLAFERPSAGPRLYVVDEASLVSTAQMHQLLDLVGVAPTERPPVWGSPREHDRLLLVGDTRQHQSVDAGKSYQQLQEAGMETARLDHVVRQRGPGYRRIVERLAAGQVDVALADLDRRGRVHQMPDRAARLAAVAADFLTSPSNTVVIDADNASRTAINEAIHQALQGARASRPATTVLVAKNEMTGTDRTYADRYAVGDVLRYAAGSRTHGIERGSYATVTATDRAQNTLTVNAGGRAVTYDPKRLSGVSVYEQAARAFEVGDRVQFTAPSRALRVANRQLGTVTRLTGTQVTVRLDTGRHLTYRLAEHPHLDWGYAMTSHSSQSLTTERVIVHIDSSRSPASLVNQRLAYVALSRGRSDAQIYTDDKPALVRNLSRDVSHRAAMDGPLLGAGL